MCYVNPWLIVVQIITTSRVWSGQRWPVFNNSLAFPDDNWAFWSTSSMGRPTTWAQAWACKWLLWVYDFWTLSWSRCCLQQFAACSSWSFHVLGAAGLGLLLPSLSRDEENGIESGSLPCKSLVLLAFQCAFWISMGLMPRDSSVQTHMSLEMPFSS